MCFTASRGSSIAHLYGSGVSFEALSAGEGSDSGREIAQPFARQFLDRDHFDEVGCTQTAALASGAGGRQDMIWAGRVIARSFRTEGSEEHATRVADFG